MPKSIAALPSGITTADGKEFVGTVMDTAYAPAGEDIWSCHNSQEFTDALKAAKPGDVIELDAGVVYSGNFVVPGLVQGDTPQWLHITTAGFHDKHPEGTRVGPGDAGDMAKIVSPNVSQALTFVSGTPNASFVRLYGIEFYSNSNYRPSGYTPGVYYGYYLLGVQGPTPFAPPMPDHIVFDRVYIHGDDTHDIQHGLQANFSYSALIDSHVSAIHMAGTDTLAYGCSGSNGPHKIVNNHVESAGENIMFGGGGGKDNPYIPADIEVRNNHIYKPLEWVPLSKSPINSMVVKNSFELKSAQRVLLEGNVIENCWMAGQNGYAVVLTVRSNQSGDIAVVDDVTIANNILRNVVSFVNTLAKDDCCNPPKCENPGSQARWNISNNLVLFYDYKAQGGGNNCGMAFNGGMDRTVTPNVHGTLRDVVFQHNTFVELVHYNDKLFWADFWFAAPPNQSVPFTPPVSDNIWILDNVLLSKGATGDWGYQGQTALNSYMPVPDGSEDNNKLRFVGNVMPYTPISPGFPPSNAVQAKIQFADSENEDYTLTSPVWEASDGGLPGVDMSQLPGHEPPPPQPATAYGVAFQLDCHTAITAEGAPVVSVTVIPDSVHLE